MRRNFFAAVVAASVASLAVGGLLYGVLFAWLFTEGAIAMEGVMRTRPDFLWILAGQLPFAVLVTLVVRWRGDVTVMGEVRTGALLGLLMAMGYDFSQYGTTHLWTLTATLADPLLSATLTAAAGGAAAVALRGRTAHGAGA